MKQLVKVDRNIPWLPQPNEVRLYVTDELPPPERCRTALGFAFEGDQLLMARLKNHHWDLPAGQIRPEETPEAAAVRGVWEQTRARVEIANLVGIQEVEVFGRKPELSSVVVTPWDDLRVQVYYLCRIVELAPFEVNDESLERGFFAPAEARRIPTMWNHDRLYDVALQRNRAINQS